MLSAVLQGCVSFRIAHPLKLTGNRMRGSGNVVPLRCIQLVALQLTSLGLDSGAGDDSLEPKLPQQRRLLLKP